MLQQEGSFPSHSARLAPSREPGAVLRLVASVRSFSLDERLAAGEDPSGSTLLAAQAARLTDGRRRERLAAALHGLLLAAEGPPSAVRVSPSRTALLRNEQAVRALARRVDSQATLYARGLARLERLLSDSTGPAFREGSGELSAELERIDAELSGRPSAQVLERQAPGAPRRGSVRRLARLRAGRGLASRADPPGFAGGSFTLPDGSWFHGRRDSA